MEQDEKGAAIEALGSYFERRFAQFNLMTQLLWMFSLYTLNQEKKLSFAQTESLPPEELLFPELEKSFAYAKSFSDGILQIIENSCIHTDAKSAYLRIRLHLVDLSASEHELMDVLRTRKRLTNHYTSRGGKSGIVIIPENHDYASMNELEVISENGSRATGVGRPSKKEGGPMVKFTYYEEFLCELPDVDINRMNRMGLNEYRAYSAMGLCVVGLNTSFSAGPIRNNKVSLFAPFIQNVRDTHDPREQIQTVWIGHHTARYRPNYSADRYYSSKIQSQSRTASIWTFYRAGSIQGSASWTASSERTSAIRVPDRYTPRRAKETEMRECLCLISV